MGPLVPRLTGSNFKIWSLKLTLAAQLQPWRCEDAVKDPALFKQAMAAAKAVLQDNTRGKTSAGCKNIPPRSIRNDLLRKNPNCEHNSVNLGSYKVQEIPFVKAATLLSLV